MKTFLDKKTNSETQTLNIIIMKKILLFISIIMLFSITGFAQEFKLKGVVVDHNGEPLKDIYVTTLENKKKHKISNYKGMFTIKVETGDTLVMIGSEETVYKTAITNQADKKFVLQTSDENIKMDGDMLSIIDDKEKERYQDIILRFKKTNVNVYYNSIFDMLKAEYPNLNVNEGPGTVQIMGMKNFALIVIDGVKGADLKNVNPQDVGSIKVVKDATAGMYGGRATGGVVVIKTKRSEK